jgi:predicted MFS family arabinose efflux permease
MPKLQSHPLAANPAVWAICPMRFLLAFGQGGLLSPLLPLLRQTFGVSYGELGLLTAMPGLSSVVMDIVAAYFLSRRPLLSILLQGIGLTSIGLVCCALAPGFYWLVGAQMLIGFGGGMIRMASLTIVVEATPLSAMGRTSNLLEFSVIAGMTISPTLSGAMASLLHWRAAFGLSMVFVAAALAWVLLTRKRLVKVAGATAARQNPGVSPTSQPTQVATEPQQQQPQTPAVLIAYLATFVLSFTWAGFISTAMSLFGGEVVGLSPSTLGVVFTVGLLADLVLLLPMGWLSDRLDYRVVLTPAMLLMAVTLAWFPEASSLMALMTVSICLHAGFAAWGMPSATLALLARGEHLARTMSIYRLLIDGAMVIAPWLIGLLIGQYGYGLPARLTAVVVLCTAILVAYGLRTARH